jgi:hypothetical protein
MRSRRALMMTALVVFLAASGWARLGQAQGTPPTDAQRLECQRNGGYWATAAGYCKAGG